MEDMVFVASARSRLGIDLGWYPDRSPHGQFRLEVVDLADIDRLVSTYAKPIREFTTRSVWAANRKMEDWMEEFQSKPAEPGASPNGGPAVPPGSSGVAEGPASVN